MIKNVKWFFVVLVFSSLISFSFQKKSVPTEKLALGDKAPELVLCNEMQPLNLQDASGNYTLLSFWASYDASSRAQNAALSHLLKNQDQVKMISISFDRYRSVFNAAVRQHQIDTASCHLEMEGENSKIFKSYGLESGFRNFLLNSEGVIVAKNVTASELASYLN